MASLHEHVERVCALLALVVAGVHLWWGLPRFALYATVGTLADPRPFAFVLSGHAIAIGITLAAVGVVKRRHLYLPGMGLMLVHLLAYAAWHTVLSHGVGGAAHHDQLTPLIVVHIVLEHLLSAPLALASKVAEAALLVLLGWLVLDTRRPSRSAD